MMSVKKAYKSWSEIYDQNENKTRDLDLLATQTVLKNISFDVVVEIGCGTGKNTKWLADKAKNIIALDFSSEMLAIARKKVLHNHVKFMEADISKEWSLESEFADLVNCNLVLEHLKDLSNVFNEAHRVLKQNGHFFISEIHPMKRFIGSQAKFENTLVESHLHHLSEYLKAGEKLGFKLIKINEWFDDETANPPRLLTLLFQKK
ncbi:MAG: class I SAM-dependent methyltransferase [Flavobacteriaceae bacterium]|nr:class I SAM-dependent methyltransferase [Flavobacteriaceae bacterium]